MTDDDKDRERPSRRRVGSGRLLRSLGPLRLGALTAARRAGVAIRSIGSDAASKEELEHRFHAETAKSYAEALGDMKGAVMKLGQILSYVEVGAIPERYRETYRRSFESLLANAPPMEFSVLDDVLTQELGAPAAEVFARLSPEPLAAASIGQVHEAVLPDGTRVAVKIQYPGVAEAIESDLSNSELLATIIRLGQGVMRGLGPRADVRTMVAELRERISDELDYRLEAQNQEYFRLLYEGHSFIRIPRIFPEFSTARVLTMEYVEGKRWADALDAPDALRQQWAEVVFRFTWGSLDRFAVFNADPHPGNYLFHDDGAVTFLDFGCVKVMPYVERTRNIDLTRAAAEGRAEDFRDLMVEAGFLRADDEADPARILDWFAGGQPYLNQRPYRFSHDDVAAYLRRVYDPVGEWSDLVRRFTIPKDRVILARIDLGLWSVLASLEGIQDWRAISEELWGIGSPATEMGRVEAEWLESKRASPDWPPVHPVRPERFDVAPVSGDADPLEAEFGDDPYAYYEQLRSQGPVQWLPPGLWLVTRYEDCLALLRADELSADPSGSEVFEALLPSGWRTGSAVDNITRKLLLFLDPPDHTRIRSLVQAAFTRRAVEGLRPRIETIVAELLDHIAGPFDLIGAFAYPLPIIVIAELLGVPVEDQSRFRAWSKDIVELVAVDDPSPERIEKRNETIAAFLDYFRTLIAVRRRDPQDDLLTALIEAEERGDKLSEDELLATCVLLLIAGHETTANLIGNGMLALVRDQHALDRLRNEPALAPSAVEELLRFDSPVQATGRTTLAEIEVGGKRIAANERVVLLLGSGNRDPDRFEQPAQLMLDRNPNPHLSLGGGIHFCLGAPLARLEARIAIPALLERFPEISLAGDDPVWRKTYPIRGLESLSVRI